MHLLLSQEDSNWDLYDNGSFVRSIAKQGTWCEDSYFGSYEHFKRYVAYKMAEGEITLDDLTERGLEIYQEGR